jgi:hypothetical protein
MEDTPTTLVALGASNLTRGFATVVNTARRVWGEPIDILAALGHGRSYGMRSLFLFRSLPGILECGLWRELEAKPRARIHAIVTDIGNDILYGAAPETVLAWVRECVTRLRVLGAEVTITDLPLDSARRLSSGRYLFFRSVLVPSCRLDLAEARARCEAVAAGIEALACSEGLRLVRLRPEWYGVDPIHIRPRFWSSAWREILVPHGELETAPRDLGLRPIGAAALYLAAPERGWLCGIERRRTQPAVRTSGGTTVRFY